MLIGGDYISNDVLTLGPCFSEFGYIHVRYALIGRNLTVVTASHRACFRPGGVGHGLKGTMGKKSKAAHLHLTFALFTSLVTPLNYREK